MKDILFTPKAFEQYTSWMLIEKSMYNRLNKLITETARTPFEGTGKPEALKRITDEDRLIYRIDGNILKIISCRFHYPQV